MAKAAIKGILLADQGLQSDASTGKLLLLRDLNGDGDAMDEGERFSFFDSGNASGLISPTGNIFTVHQARDGAVFIGDGDTDTVYRLLDKNYDGDANDADEATAWLKSDVANGFSLVTPNGIAQGADGAIYIVNAGTSSAPQDAIYRTIDLNGDGDAMDEGEASVWLDLQTVAPTSSAFELVFSGKVAYLIDPAGPAEDVIHRIEDKNGDGSISADEVTKFIGKNNSFGAPIEFALAEDNGSILVWEYLAGSDAKHSLYRLTDRDGSGAINQADEAVEIWNSTSLPADYATRFGFSVAASGDGRVALTSNGGNANQKNVILLTDKNGDGSYLGEGETAVYASNASDPETLYRPRAVEFYDGPQAPTPPTTPTPTPPAAVVTNLDGSTAITLTQPLTAAQLAQYATAGIDTVASPFSVVLPEGIENVTLTGTGNINATGNSGANAITGNSGSNILTGDAAAGSASVVASGGIAHSNLAVGGADTITAGEGNDVVFGNQGADVLFGNQGNDTLYGGKDDDAIYGGKDDDYIEGNLGNDYIEGNLGNDLVLGNQGNDTVNGNQGNDTVHGGQGNDLVHGGQGDDLVFGDKGNDQVWGGLGNDTLVGGEGSDTFFFGQTSGNDIIVDFNAAEGDRLDFQGQTYVVQNVDGSAVFTLSGGGTVTLTGVTAASLDAGAFA